MGLSLSIRVLAVAAAALCACVSATVASAAEAPAKPMDTYHGCTPNSGEVAGADGIYYLRARSVGCKQARTVVRRYHAKRDARGGDRQTVEDFTCTASYTEGYEGLKVGCRGPDGESVGWTAYIVQ